MSTVFVGDEDDVSRDGCAMDRLVGGNDNDNRNAKLGRHELIGEQRSDSIYGGDDGDPLYGGDGDDGLFRRSANDQLMGGALDG